jgi:hypothetical protein
MDEFNRLSEFLAYLFDEGRVVEKAQAITAGLHIPHAPARC